MRSDQAKTIAIDQYLSHVEGLKPVNSRMGGKELWYHSPIREGDKTPSFKVDTEKNLWFDHGANHGGKIIDLVCAIRNVTVREALSILENSGLYQGGTFHRTAYNNKAPSLFQNQTNKPSASEKEKSSSSAYVILDVKPLQNPALVEYLKSRCIDRSIADAYLKEVHFKHPNKLAAYYALGWKSGEGYEVRNKYFKGFAGTGKAITTINLDEHDEWLVFEGFMDFLSYLTFIKQQKNSASLNKGVVVLNSTALKKQLIPLAQEKTCKTLYCFVDNDDAGQNVLEYFQDVLEGQKIVDMRYLYDRFKDVNQMIVCGFHADTFIR